MHRCGTYSCIDYFNRVDGLRVLHDLHDASGCAGEHQISRGSFHALLRRRFIRLSRGALLFFLVLMMLFVMLFVTVFVTQFFVFVGFTTEQIRPSKRSAFDRFVVSPALDNCVISRQ
jgi:hypothetical protein